MERFQLLGMVFTSKKGLLEEAPLPHFFLLLKRASTFDLQFTFC